MSQSFGYGDQTWPNLDSLILDASEYQYYKARSDQLRRLLYAVVKNLGPIKVDKIDLDANQTGDLFTNYDPATNSWVMEVIE